MHSPTQPLFFFYKTLILILTLNLLHTRTVDHSPPKLLAELVCCWDKLPPSLLISFNWFMSLVLLRSVSTNPCFHIWSFFSHLPFLFVSNLVVISIFTQSEQQQLWHKNEQHFTNYPKWVHDVFISTQNQEQARLDEKVIYFPGAPSWVFLRFIDSDSFRIGPIQ